MANGAPVCPVSKSEAIAGQPPAQQTIVPAVDLPSAIMALNQIAQILQTLPKNNLAPAFIPAPGASSSGQSGSGGGGRVKPGWEEVERTTDHVRVINPDDDSVSVPLDRISHLLFRERKTQVTLEWNL
jgi:hypothetical protein